MGNATRQLEKPSGHGSTVSSLLCANKPAQSCRPFILRRISNREKDNSSEFRRGGDTANNAKQTATSCQIYREKDRSDRRRIVLKLKAPFTARLSELLWPRAFRCKAVRSFCLLILQGSRPAYRLYHSFAQVPIPMLAQFRWTHGCPRGQFLHATGTAARAPVEPCFRKKSAPQILVPCRGAWFLASSRRQSPEQIRIFIRDPAKLSDTGKPWHRRSCRPAPQLPRF